MLLLLLLLLLLQDLAMMADKCWLRWQNGEYENAVSSVRHLLNWFKLL